jgi:hypothetical protein
MLGGSSEVRAMAERRVQEGRRTIARQRELIARQKALGQDTTISQSLLDEFEQSQTIFETDLHRINSESH